MSKCQSCNKDIEYRRTRCWDCYVKYAKQNVKPYPECKHCGKPLSDRRAITCQVCSGIDKRGKHFPHCLDCGVELKSYIAKRCRQCIKGELASNYGKKHSQKVKDKISKKLIGVFRGEKSVLWKGGCALRARIAVTRKYKEWRFEMFKRDDFTCQLCNTRGKKLNLDHHPIPMSKIIRDNNLKTLDDVFDCEQLWDTSNVRTLCLDCHKKTDTYLSNYHKTYKKQKF